MAGFPLGRVLGVVALSAEQRVEQPDQLPEPSAGLVLWRVSIQALISTMPRRKAERFLRTMAETLASESSVSEILPIRPRSDREAVQQAGRGAMAAFHALLPTFMAILRDE